jgi:hypothetical protein
MQLPPESIGLYSSIYLKLVQKPPHLLTLIAGYKVSQILWIVSGIRANIQKADAIIIPLHFPHKQLSLMVTKPSYQTPARLEIASELST